MDEQSTRQHPIQSSDGNSSAESGRGTSAAVVALAADAELFHARDGETAYATVRVHGHEETWAIGSKGFRRWLSHRYYEQRGAVPSSQAMNDAITALQGKAMFDGQAREVFVRVGEAGGKIYLDLGNEHWEAVEITPVGWNIVSSPPVKFRRPMGMAPLPLPEGGGSLALLRSLVNVHSEADFTLLVGWLVSLLMPGGPYAALVLHGEQGTGKTTLTRVLRDLIDPSTISSRGAPTKEVDMLIAANNSRVVTFDNVSHLLPKLSDVLCRILTGGSFTKRELYTDFDETVISVCRPIIINGIEEMVTRADLLSRSIVITLSEIPPDQKVEDGALRRMFEEAHPRILGLLLDAAVTALKRYADVAIAQLPRIADVARFVTAAAPALGWNDTAFLNAYWRNTAELNEFAVEAAPVGSALRDFVETEGSWHGTAGELLAELNAAMTNDFDYTRRPRGWPDSPKGMANALRRLQTNLRGLGIEVIFHSQRGTGGRRLITLRRNLESTVPTVPTVTRQAPSAPSGPVRDGSDDRDDDPGTSSGRRLYEEVEV